MKNSGHTISPRDPRIEPINEPDPIFSDIRDLLTEIRDELRDLNGRSDITDDIALMRAIQTASRGLAFTAVDLVTAVEIDVARGDASALGDAIRSAAGFVNSRSLGRWLGDHEGETLGDLRFVRLGKAREGVSWRVENVRDSENIQSRPLRKRFSAS